MSDQLTKAFKELLNQERFASQSEIVEALKNQGFMIIYDTVFDLLYQIKKHGQFVSLENAKNIIHQLQVQGYKGLEDINEKKTWHILKIVETP